MTLNFSFLSSSGDSKVSATSPLSPSELLVALHQIEAKSDMKSVMKGKLSLSVNWYTCCGWSIFVACYKALFPCAWLEKVSLLFSKTNNKHLLFASRFIYGLSFVSARRLFFANHFLLPLFPTRSQQPVFRREDHLHSGGVGSGSSSADGDESSPYPVHENGNIFIPLF